jgi:hypothetical protein
MLPVVDESAPTFATSWLVNENGPESRLNDLVAELEYPPETAMSSGDEGPGVIEPMPN